MKKVPNVKTAFVREGVVHELQRIASKAPKEEDTGGSSDKVEESEPTNSATTGASRTGAAMTSTAQDSASPK